MLSTILRSGPGGAGGAGWWGTRRRRAKSLLVNSPGRLPAPPKGTPRGGHGRCPLAPRGSGKDHRPASWCLCRGL